KPPSLGTNIAQPRNDRLHAGFSRLVELNYIAASIVALFPLIGRVRRILDKTPGYVTGVAKPIAFQFRCRVGDRSPAQNAAPRTAHQFVPPRTFDKSQRRSMHNNSRREMPGLSFLSCK